MKSLLKKTKKKLGLIKNKYIRLNFFYKPDELIQSSKKYFLETNGEFYQYIELEEKLEYTLPIPNNLLEQIPSHSIVDDVIASNENQKTFINVNDLFINSIPNGRLVSDNLYMVWVITGNNKLLADVSFQFDNGYPIPPSENRVLKRSFFKKPLILRGTVCNLLNGGGGVGNYYHWMIDFLPRLKMLKDAGWLEKIDYFVVPGYFINFQIDSLKLLGIDKEKVISAHLDLHIQADLLVTTSHPRSLKSILVPGWITDFHRKSFLPLVDKSESVNDKIYISRLDTKLRPIYNEDKLIDILEKKGFKVLILSKLSMLEKIKVFHGASIVVGATGAGLTSLMYCKAGTNVLEIFGPGRAHTHYYNLAYNAGLKYNFIICDDPESSVNSRGEGVLKGYSVDLNQVEKEVDNLLN